MPIGYRDGRVGILATLVLLVSAVIFIGSLFWLTLNGPWSGGSLFGNDLFKPAGMTVQEPETQTLIETEHEWNISEAIEDLTSSGCVFTEYKQVYLSSETIPLEYEQFKEEAIDRKIVYKTVDSWEAPVLLVINNGKIYEWTP